MAFTSTKLKHSVFGDTRVEIYSYTSTGTATGSIVTGLASIDHVDWTPATIRASSTIDHTTTAGTIAFTGLTASDTGRVIAYKF